MLTLIFLGAAAVTVIIGGIAEHHIVNDSWGKAKLVKQEVKMSDARYMIRHRGCYQEIGCRVQCMRR